MSYTRNARKKARRRKKLGIAPVPGGGWNASKSSGSGQPKS